MRKSRGLGAALVGGLLVGFGMWRGRLRRFEVTENSMVPALEDGDYLIATHLVSAPLRGDIVVFPHPRLPEFLMIKRVIGLPGESLSIREGKLAVNRHVLAEPWARGALDGSHDWELDGRQLVVLSDNRNESTEDSRELGPLPLGDLWKVSFRYWPLRRIGRVR
ncbi:MAG: signal peptidase I [Acidimicrobiia bacterium]